MIDGTLSRKQIIAVLALFYFFAGTTLSVAQDESVSSLNHNQQAQVLEQAVQILGGNANVIVRWNTQVNFAVVGGSPEAQQTAHEVILEVGGIAGMPVELIEHPITDASQYLSAVNATPEFQLDICNDEHEQLCSNFVLVFTDNQTMYSIANALPMRDVYTRALEKALNRAESIPCFFSPYHVREAEILQALVYVNDSLSDDMLSTCVHEEIYQSFGLFADVTDSDYFSFDNRVVPKQITEYDRALLQALYDSTLGPGAPVFAVLKILLRDLSFDLYEPASEQD